MFKLSVPAPAASCQARHLPVWRCVHPPGARLNPKHSGTLLDHPDDSVLPALSALGASDLADLFCLRPCEIPGWMTRQEPPQPVAHLLLHYFTHVCSVSNRYRHLLRLFCMCGLLLYFQSSVANSCIVRYRSNKAPNGQCTPYFLYVLALAPVLKLSSLWLHGSLSIQKMLTVDNPTV